jgi:hypothetical protein
MLAGCVCSLSSGTLGVLRDGDRYASAPWQLRNLLILYKLFCVRFYIMVLWFGGSNARRTFHVQKWHCLFSALLELGQHLLNKHLITVVVS